MRDDFAIDFPDIEPPDECLPNDGLEEINKEAPIERLYK